MRPRYPAAVAFLLVALPGCRERTGGAEFASQAIATVPAESAFAPDRCPIRPTDVRLGIDTIAGLPTRRPLAELGARCPQARVDTAGVRGTSPPALRFDVPGAAIWAIQTAYDAHGDSLHPAESADLWAASGDSLRFPDGTLVPGRVGALRAIDSVGAVVVDHGDDGTGSYVVLCRFPRLALVVDNIWPPFAKAGVVPFARVRPADTARFWRVEVLPGRPELAQGVAAVCGPAPAARNGL